MNKQRYLFFKYGLVLSIVLLLVLLILQLTESLENSFNYLTLVFSFFAICISLYSCKIADEAYHSSLRPILVFVLKNDGGKKRWMIENVGNGAALNIRIYRGDLKTDWLEGKKFYPIPARTRIECPLQDACNRLGAAYESVTKEKYHSICGDYYTALEEGEGPVEWNKIPTQRHEELTEREPL
ncbi:hypothetical protein [Gimesia sp.]|uniref:hypothetical protein n=1 Tax=Gimesia sp. TaxID=2024833 RepID=UPI0032EF79A1